MKSNSTLVFLLTFGFFFPQANSYAQPVNRTEMTQIGLEGFSVMRQFFDYDKNVPLNAETIERIDKPEYIREKIVFEGAHQSRVPGYLAIPKSATGSYPCVLQIHGLTGSKENWWEDNGTMGQLTKQLIAAGFAVMSLDAQYHGQRMASNDFKSPLAFLDNGLFVRSRDMIIQSTIDYRRAIDYLATRAEVDTTKIGVIGYSMGGIMTFNLTAVDARVKVAVSAVAPIITVPYLPTAVNNYAPYISKQPFLMLMAKNDERNYSTSTAQQLFKLLATNKKDIVFFDSGHMLPVGWTKHATNWMVTNLK